ncbi:MAG: phage tail tape measure protein, partial [Gemmatimonadaceae bacterium]
MATIYRLVTQLAADPAPMKAGFDRGLAITKEFARAAAKAIGDVPKNTGEGFVAAGTQAAIDLLDALNKTYAARQTELLEAFARGSLSKGQFAELGDEAAKSFNTALLNGITKLDKKKAIPPEARAALVNSLQETGIAASDAFENGLTTIGSKTRSLGRDLTQIGRELSIGLTAPIAAGAIAAIAASNIFEHAIDDIRVATGKVGPSLDEMEGHLRTLFTQLPNSAADIGHALQIITQFTGASGDQLDALATQALNLSRITGSDLASGLTTAQHAFQGFNVSTKDQLGAMDTLFKTSQQTGVAVGDLAGNLAQFAPAFRQLGLGFGQSAALLGQFTKEGLNADAIITTLQNSLSKFALKGVDTSSALTLVIDSLKKAGSDAEAINLASRIFGPREAVQISTAARNGSLDIQKLTDSVRISAITINGVADQTDTFATALDKVGKAAGVVTATVGDQLKASFLQIAPALLEALDDITHLVKAFTELPRPVGVFLEVIAGLLAVLGPAALLFGGVAKAIGSTVLAFGLLKDAKVAAAVSDVGTAGLAASGALSEAGEAAVKLGLGLKALQTSTVIGLGLAALAAVLLLVTHQFRDAKEKLDAFKTSLQGLSNSELELKTTKLQKDIDDRQKQIDALAKSVADANATNVTAGRFAATPGPKDPNAIANTSLQFMRDNQRAAVDSLAAVGLQFKDNGEQAEIAAQKQELYFKAVFAGIKQFSGKSSVSIDPTGSIKGTVADLEKEAGLMQQALDNGFTSPRISADELRSGMERLQRQAAALKNGSKGIGDIFDQESPGITNLGLAISGTLGHLKQFGNAFEQLAQTGSTNSVLRNLALVNAALEHTGNSSKIDVQRLREFKSQLDASLAAQLTSNTDNSHAYRVDVIGNVKKIEIDSSQTGIVLAGFQDGLRKVHDDAEEAAVATLNLQRATASGNLFAIRDATTASQAAFSKLNDEANRYKGLVGTSGQSLTDQQHALAQLDETMKKLNVDTSLVHGFTISAEDIAAIGPEFQRILARIPPLKIPVTVDSMAGAQAADTAAAAIQKSLFNALAGGGGTTVANERTAILNKFAREQAKIAQDAVKPGGIGAANAMTEIAANAKAAGFSVEELAKAMEHLSTRGQITGIADNFAAVASAIFGANSAMSQFAQSIKAGVDGFFQLKDAIAALKSGGGSFADVFSGVTSVATAVVGAIGIVSKLFGKSQLDVEHDNILKQNNSALATLTNTLDRQAGTAERTAQLTQGLTAVSADLKTLQTGKGQFDDTFKNAFQKALDANGGNPAAVNIATTAGVTAELLKFHLTIAQATAAAKALNITLVDSKGNFTGLDAFMTALGENATILTSLASDLSTTQKLTAVKESLQGGKVTAQQKLQDSVGDIIKTIGNANSTVTQQLTAGLAGGPQALRAAFQKIVDEIQAGSLSLSDLGGLTDVSQLLDAIGGTSDALNALTGASNNLLGALVNVPSGFKKALDEFNAGAVSAGPPTAPTPPNPTPTPPFTGAPGTEPGAHDPTTILANFA